jgi:hypothetical protein
VEPAADDSLSYGKAPETDSAITPLPSPPMVVSEDSVPGDLANVPPPNDVDSAVGSGDDRFNSLAEVAIMPPPIAGDPWAPLTESHSTDDGGVA